LPEASWGTLKSTRTSTRFPCKSCGRSASVFLAIAVPPRRHRDHGLHGTHGYKTEEKRKASMAFPSFTRLSFFRVFRVFRGLITPAYHEAQQVHTAVRVAPLVVVPADQLEEAAVQLDTRARVEDARRRVVDEVAGDHLVVGVGQDPLEVRLARPLH